MAKQLKSPPPKLNDKLTKVHAWQKAKAASANRNVADTVFWKLVLAEYYSEELQYTKDGKQPPKRFLEDADGFEIVKNDCKSLMAKLNNGYRDIFIRSLIYGTPSFALGILAILGFQAQ